MTDQEYKKMLYHMLDLKDKKGYSYQVLADMIEINYVTLYRYMIGEAGRFPLRIAIDLAKALDVSMDELINFKK